MSKKIPDLPTRINVVKDSYSSDAQTLFSSYAMNKHNLIFEGLKIKHKDIETVIEEITNEYPDMEKHYYPMTMFYDFYVLESDDYLLVFDSYDGKKKVNINFYFNSYKEANKIFDIIKSHEDRDEELFISLSTVYMENNNVKLNNSIKNLSEFEGTTSDFYPYLDTNELFRQYIMSDSNILLLCGKPGIGKTRLGNSFMEYLLTIAECDADIIEQKTTKSIKFTNELLEIDPNVNIVDVTNVIEIEEYDGVKVAYVKNEEILAKDEFWNILQEESFKLVFLDDLDYGLLPRTQNVGTSEDINKNKFISNLLSFTDGIFEAGNNTKFIITTNREVKDIDTAVLRKGRTFDILELRDLSKDEALKIWLKNGLSEEAFNKEFSNDKRVLQADLGSAITMTLKSLKANKELKPYIKEDNISLYSKVKNPKKIGL